MGFSCFPVSMQAGNSLNDDRTSNFQIDLLTEVANTIIDLTRRVRSRPQAPQAPSGASEVASVSPLSDSDDRMKLAFAANPRTSILRLTELSSHPNAAVRTEVVFNPSTPPSLLFELANDQDRFVAAQARARLTMAA